MERRTRVLPTATVVVALATLATGSHLAQSIGYVGVSLAIVPIAVWLVRADRLDARLATGLVVLGALNAAANLLRTLGERRSGLDTYAEIFGLAAAATVVVVLSWLAWNRRSPGYRAILADAGIVAIGCWLVSWVAIVRPTMHDFDDIAPRTLLSAAFQPVGAVILFLLFVVVFSEKARSTALVLTSLAIGLALSAGILRGLHESGHIGDHLDVGIALGTVALGLFYTAVTHPSLQTLTTTTPDTPRRSLGVRFAVTSAALIVPVIVLTLTMPVNALDKFVRTASVSMLAVLVIARTIQSTRSSRNAQVLLLRSAQSDSLTGLPNRVLLLQRLNEALHEPLADGAQPTLFFIDLDRFKHINDNLGHLAGDQVLRIIALRLRASVPARAIVARISGDEYVVFDPASPALADAMTLADRLLAQFREPLNLGSRGRDIFVTASIGVARLGPQIDRDADVLLRLADTAMYQAKDAGRNCVALFDEGKDERASHRLSLETDLFRALDRNELKLHYQPIMDMGTGEVTGFEALMRWQRADGTMASPAEFIPIAEENGTIVPIGAWALLEALTQLRTWIDERVCSPRASMSVNVSPRQLADPTFSIVVDDALMRARISPSLLWLEVTEGIMISEPDVALATLRRLRSLGVRMAIDDFGTGYSSLSSLQQFPLQRIKIDRAFVQGVADNPNDRALVRTIIAMGASLGLEMVAEGVETFEQLQVLSGLGCTMAQGYLISRPMPETAMRETVARIEQTRGRIGDSATGAYASPVASA